MKKNKGFAPILIALIVAGVLVVCGVIYFFSKNSYNNAPENTGICGRNGEFCPGTPGYEERIKRENQNTETTKDSDKIKNVDISESLKEYKNIEAGFSFKYPAEYGEVIVTKDSPDDIGYAFLGSVGTSRKLSFNFFTKDFLVGDADPAEVHDVEYETCNQPGTSCESISSKNGSMLRLATRQSSLTSIKDYLLMVPLSNNINYRDLSFSSNDRSILVNIASQLEISN
ncbi:MAG: hypothetical protein WCG45_01470 [bacterium]